MSVRAWHRGTGLAVLLALGLALTACDYVDPPHAGIGLDATGRPVVRYHPCTTPGGVDGVWLFDCTTVTPENPDPTPENDVWQIEASEPVNQTSFAVGETPEGFREVLALDQELEPGRDYHAGVSAERESTHATFHLEDLAPGMVLVDGDRSVPTEEFDDWAAGQCNRDPGAEVARFWLLVLLGFGLAGGLVVWFAARSARKTRLSRLPPPPQSA